MYGQHITSGFGGILKSEIGKTSHQQFEEPVDDWVEAVSKLPKMKFTMNYKYQSGDTNDASKSNQRPQTAKLFSKNIAVGGIETNIHILEVMIFLYRRNQFLYGI